MSYKQYVIHLFAFISMYIILIRSENQGVFPTHIPNKKKKFHLFYPAVQKINYNLFLTTINGYCTWRIIPTLQFMYRNGSVLGGNFYCRNEWYIATSSCWAEILFVSIESIKYVMKFSMNMRIEIYGCSRSSNVYTTAYSTIQCNEKHSIISWYCSTWYKKRFQDNDEYL